MPQGQVFALNIRRSYRRISCETYEMIRSCVKKGMSRREIARRLRGPNMPIINHHPKAEEKPQYKRRNIKVGRTVALRGVRLKKERT
jgi:hypothetical protein